MSNEDKIFTAKIVNNGKITIPIETREVNRISDGDIVTIKIVSINKKTELLA